ncbi:MAG TPA: peptidylprolyl isomerase [Nitrospinota bacterium]|nr:peptidylprolyl isomerase [Nitrospinota bacterium]|tara:strand:+ start:145384 stop:146352 length:969 start_codon:yes stop_codon:yes gene_type:complete
MQKKRFIFYFLLIVTLQATGCFKDQDRSKSIVEPKNAALAIIGNRTITVSEFEHAVDKYKLLLEVSGFGLNRSTENIRRTTLNRLVNERILLEEAENHGITVSKKELDREIKLLLDKHDKSKLNVTLGKLGSNIDEWKKMLEQNIKIEKLVSQQVDSKIIIDNTAEKNFFRNNLNTFRLPERIKAKHILVDNKVKAYSIRKKLLTGGDFATIAKENSQNISDYVDSYSYLVRGQIPIELEDVVFRLKVGEISKIVKSQYGFHIIKLVKLEKARLMNFTEAQPRIKNFLFKQKREKEFNSWLEKVRLNTKVTINWELLSLGPQ